MSEVVLKDKIFGPYLSERKIKLRVKEMAEELSAEYEDQNPLFLAVLNGAFVFAADIFRELSIECEISFIKLASYSGTSSTGNARTLIGLAEPLNGRHVVILEDIIDSGQTLSKLVDELKELFPASINVVSLFLKPDSAKVKIDYHKVGFEIPSKFVVGYGLDYDGQGRNLSGLYILNEK